MVPMTGRYIFDLFQVIKAEHKLESYSLNNVSLEFLKDQKNDMPIHEMFSLFETNQNLTDVGLYCIKDTELPLKLMDTLYTFENLVEMAKATWVPLSFLSERGQQIKVFSQVAKKARELGFMIPTLFTKPEQPEYEGATVLHAHTGAYYKPITALDFASLYPSIMIAHNLCYSTLVLEEKYKNIPGIQYETHGDHIFVQDVPSLLPEILKDLKEFRKKAKKDMAKSKGTNMYHIYNGKQLAYKISMNSVYGFTGASRGILPCVAIASTVTRIGRSMIQASKEYVEEHFPGSIVRYGDTDSIMVEFDVGDRKGKDAIEYSWELGEQASKQITSIFKKPNELELEKVYCPYFLYSKKRYAAKKWVKEGDECVFDEIDIKGLQVVRRDTCQYVRETCQEILDRIMESSNAEDALKFIGEKRKTLQDGNVPMEKLILSKRLGNSYKNNNLAHVVVRDKMKERAPGSEPQSGDRVQFVLVKGPKKAKMYEKAEDPKWVKDNNLELDYEYYLKHQFETPVKDLIEPIIG
jgi:DNA polymerase delta subunit 1